MRPVRDRTRHSPLFRTDLPHGVMVPASPPGKLARAKTVAAPVLKPARRLARSVAAEVAAFALVSLAIAVVTHVSVAQLSPPSPPQAVCGNHAILDGPSSPPVGAVTVPAGDNSGVNLTLAATTYWFASGTHTLGSSQFSQINAGQGSTYTGAPGAVIDGQGLNQFAFAGTRTDVTVEHLTIQNFIPPGAQGAVNINGEPDWTLEFDTVQDNLPGAGAMVGSNNVLSGNCMTQNGEYAFNAFTVNSVSALTGGPSNTTVTGNEMSFNNTCNWENVSPWPFPAPPAGCTGAGQFTGCGCSGADKYWEADTGTYSDNYVHDNYSNGSWWDTNDTGFTVSGNYFADNYAPAVEYEISYNLSVTGNTFVRNGVGVGPTNPGFPTGAVYISESGSDPRVAGPYGTQLTISNNGFYDNWGGVVLWENANRYCTSIANTSSGICTLVNPSVANLTTCNGPVPAAQSHPAGGAGPAGRRSLPRAGTGQGQGFQSLIARAPYVSDCRWKTQNVQVAGNLFDFSAGDLGASCTTGNLCGFSGVFSEFGTIYPFQGTSVEQNITFHQGNLFTGNTYCGPWQFMAQEQGTIKTYAQWQASPYLQDAGSTLNGAACTAAALPAPPAPAPGQRTVTIPYRGGRR